MKLSGRLVSSALIICAVFLFVLTTAPVPCGAITIIYKTEKSEIIGPQPEPEIRIGEPGDYGGGRASPLTSSAEVNIPTEPEDNKATPENIKSLLMRIFWQQLKSSARILR